jgi:hypothetical protein
MLILVPLISMSRLLLNAILAEAILRTIELFASRVMVAAFSVYAPAYSLAVLPTHRPDEVSTDPLALARSLSPH